MNKVLKSLLLSAVFVMGTMVQQTVNANARNAIQPLVVGGALAAVGFYAAHTKTYSSAVRFIADKKLAIGFGMAMIWAAYTVCPKVLCPNYTGKKKDKKGVEKDEKWTDRLSNPLEFLAKFLKLATGVGVN